MGVDIFTDVKQIDPTLRDQRISANEMHAWTMWSHDENGADQHTSGTIDEAGPLWWNFIQTGEGEVPPQWVREAFNLDKARWGLVPGTAEYNALLEQGYAWERANLPLITLVEKSKYPLIISARMGNVVANTGYAIALNFSGEQFFYRE